MKEQKMERYWINAPSTLQEDHGYHGLNVLAEAIKGEFVTVYPISGNVISMRVFKKYLSKGWLHKKV